MKHCLNSELWSGFLDRTLPPQQETGAGEHLVSCPHCRLLATEFVRVEDLLTGVARQARPRVALSAAEISQTLDRLRAQIQPPCGITRCLESLRVFLAGMLGTSTASKVIQSAARHTGIDEDDWLDFIVRLSGTISDLCGEGAAAIVVHIGKLAEPI